MEKLIAELQAVRKLIEEHMQKMERHGMVLEDLARKILKGKR